MRIKMVSRYFEAVQVCTSFQLLELRFECETGPILDEKMAVKRSETNSRSEQIV